MLLDSLAGMSGITLICAGVVVLARTQGPELSLPALLGIVWELAGAGSAALTWRGLLPGWAVPAVVVLAVAAVWALVVGRRRSRLVSRATGFGDLGENSERGRISPSHPRHQYPRRPAARRPR